MPPAPKTLSPAELAKLEHAFATDPVSEAYKPLAEAYLGMGRFMEAMVVCKKGVKAHPNRTDPRVLLARVYADQGKDKKAIEELQAALQIQSADKAALRMLGMLQLKGGEAAPGKENLLKAFEADKADGETLEAMQKYGVEVPKPPEPPPPPPAPVVVAPPADFAEAPTEFNGSGEPEVPVDPVEPPPRASQPQRRQTGTQPALRAKPVPSRPPGPPPHTGRTGKQPAFERADLDDEPVEPPRKQPKPGSSRAMFFLLIFAVPAAALAYYGFGQYKAKQVREANKLLREATDKLKSDTFAAYQQATTAAENALSLDGSSDTNRTARGLLAYGYTVRWGEHQHDDTNRESAEKNIKAGLEAKDSSSFLYAADALFDYYNGRGAQALKKIQDRIRQAEADKKQVSLYYLTQGLISMNAGALEDARESLEKAQAIAPDDPRVFVALGTLHRRRGADIQALQAFNNALKYTRNSHPDALLGTANLVLDTENPAKGYISAAQYLKTLFEMEPPPSPRQLAQAHFVKALLVSRVAADLPLYKDEAFKKDLEDKTGVAPDKDKAAREIQKEENEGLALDRNNPELLLVRGHRLAWENRFDEAASDLRKAIEMNNQAAHYQVELAKVLMRKEGGDAQAEDSLRKALSMVQDSPKLLTMLGQVQYRQKKMTEAQGTLEKATRDEKQRNPDARFLLGKIYRDERKDLEKAARFIEKAAQEYFADPTQAAAAYDELGVTLETRAAAGDKDKARTAYEKALNADKEYPGAYCHYAKFLSKSGDGKDREKMKALATEYLKQEAQGSCAGDMQRLREG